MLILKICSILILDLNLISTLSNLLKQQHSLKISIKSKNQDEKMMNKLKDFYLKSCEEFYKKKYKPHHKNKEKDPIISPS